MLYPNIDLESFQTYLFSLEENRIEKCVFDLVRIIRTDKCFYSLFHIADDDQENESDESCAYMFSFLLITNFVVCAYY